MERYFASSGTSRIEKTRLRPRSPQPSLHPRRTSRPRFFYRTCFLHLHPHVQSSVASLALAVEVELCLALLCPPVSLANVEFADRALPGHTKVRVRENRTSHPSHNHRRRRCVSGTGRPGPPRRRRRLWHFCRPRPHARRLKITHRRSRSSAGRTSPRRHPKFSRRGRFCQGASRGRQDVKSLARSRLLGEEGEFFIVSTV